jgi:hypothetical protein
MCDVFEEDEEEGIIHRVRYSSIVGGERSSTKDNGNILQIEIFKFSKVMLTPVEKKGNINKYLS